ncbi:hypothetical protein B0T19DRAFT_263303 [Cercophora scortea]|uniref:Geranylgeranyl pyrophosphate synthetase n=1 Tax=Cercophora scortea TaxID=314031 RepID=A0AAE0IA01_9PEZI|nr:hypothetical protein B0T19DRAFT_263303 [Cercophora scortea]
MTLPSSSQPPGTTAPIASVCVCRRRFGSVKALEQHQRNKPCPISPVPATANEATPGIVKSQVSAAETAASTPVKNKEKKKKKQKAAPTFKTEDQRDQWMAKGAGELVETINSQSLEPVDVPVSSRDGHELICSYSWMHSRVPTVCVPGAAPKWAPLPLPIQIPKDSGVQYVDQNAARVPRYPFEVLFQATEVMNPGFRFDGVDVLVNRSSLRRLFDFCRRHKQDSFRLNLFALNNTLIIDRCEKKAKIRVQGSTSTGFGHSFETHFTQLPSGMETSSGYHRVLQYNLGGLTCAVRFEVDAYYHDHGLTPTPSQAGDENTEQAAASNTPVQLAINGQVKVIQRGSTAPQSTIAEIKTRPRKRNLHSELSQTMPQLWFGRTPYFILGGHSSGSFEAIDVRYNTPGKFEAWETSNQGSLCKLARLLGLLRDAVKGTPERSCVAIMQRGAESMCLEIFRSTHGRKPLPDPVVKMFWTE